MNQSEIQSIYNQIFPNSSIEISTGFLGSHDLYISCYLAKDEKEVFNGIIQNDNLQYRFVIDHLGNYKESALSLHLISTNKYYAMDTAFLRKQSIKNINSDKLKKRFIKIKQFITDNKDKLYCQRFYNINDKLI